MRQHLFVFPLRKSHTKGMMALLFAKEGNDLPRTKAHKADDVPQNQKIINSAAILLKLKPVTTETPSSCPGDLVPELSVFMLSSCLDPGGNHLDYTVKDLTFQIKESRECSSS